MSSRQAVRLVLLVILAAFSWYFGKPQPQGSSSSRPAPATASVSASARQTWGRPETLPDHFARHGRDFGARDPDDYAAQAHAFLERAKAGGLPAKRDHDGSLRIYDPSTGAFAAYNPDGTTKTFFKPGSPHYFDHQPGEPVDLRVSR
jgi:pyocin large subunit-like protein